MARIDRASREVRAEPEAVYRALTDPAALVAWLPPDGMSGRFDRFDPGQGGGYRLVLTYQNPGSQGKTTENTDVVETRFVELTPGERVVQEVDFESDDPRFTGTMRMSWSLTPSHGGTEVSIACENVPEGIRPEDHEVGLNSSLDNLAGYLE